MKTKGLQKAFAPHVHEFFSFIKTGNNKVVSYDLFLQFKNLCNANQTCDVSSLANKFRSSTT